MIQDKEEQQINKEFVKNAILDDQTRKLILKHYNSIIKEEKNIYQKTNNTLALKLV